MTRTYLRARLNPDEERGATIVIVVLSLFAIISMLIISRGCQRPPGQGSGKFVAGKTAELNPRVFDFASCSRVMLTGVISFALAASERMPIEL